MRRVARNTTFGFNDRMFKYEWPGLIGVAFETNGVISGSRAELARIEPAVRIVAVRALYQSLVHPMVKRSRELLIHFQVAAIAQLRLSYLH